MNKPICQDFWANVKVGQPEECWPWLRATIPPGYGVFARGKEKVYAHRHACESAHGPIPEGWLACHKCDNPICCNPSHLYAGTHADNARDAVERRKPRPVTPPRIKHVSMVDYRRKIKTNDLPVIKQRRADGESLASIARDYGIDQSTVSLIARDKYTGRRSK